MNNQDLANIVKYHRKRTGLSRNALANIAGVSETVIYYLEHGKQSLQWDTVSKILHALNIHINFQSPLMQDYEKSKDIRS